MRWFFLVILVMILPTMTNAKVDGQTCQPFFQALQRVPYESIFQREGLYNSQYFETGTMGCFLVMNTSASRLDGLPLPDFSGKPGTMLYDAGWRIIPRYSADGPGTSMVGLQKDAAFCLVYFEQPSYIDDAGRIIEEQYIRLRVECMQGKEGGEPWIILRKKQ